MEPKLWFKRKLYGWGFVPASWQGWISTLVYLFLVLSMAIKIEEDTSFREQFWPFIVPFFILTLLFVLLASWKGEKPKWQWGENKEEKSIKK